jgi:hypothetical protein
MRVLLAAVLVASTSAGAFAQGTVPRYGETEKTKSPQEIQAEKDAERAYRHSLSNIPDKGPGDPWGAVRSNEPSKTGESGNPGAKPKNKASTATPKSGGPAAKAGSAN